MAFRAGVLEATLAGFMLAGSVPAALAHGDYDARPRGELGVIPVHGDYDWIRRGGYKGVDGSSCCGKDDCDQIPAARVERTPQGYALRDFDLFVPFRQTQTSEDGKFWLCRDARLMRCFFAPLPGS